MEGGWLCSMCPQEIRKVGGQGGSLWMTRKGSMTFKYLLDREEPCVPASGQEWAEDQLPWTLETGFHTRMTSEDFYSSQTMRTASLGMKFRLSLPWCLGRECRSL